MSEPTTVFTDYAPGRRRAGARLAPVAPASPRLGARAILGGLVRGAGRGGVRRGHLARDPGRRGALPPLPPVVDHLRRDRRRRPAAARGRDPGRAAPLGRRRGAHPAHDPLPGLRRARGGPAPVPLRRRRVRRDGAAAAGLLARPRAPPRAGRRLRARRRRAVVRRRARPRARSEPAPALQQQRPVPRDPDGRRLAVLPGRAAPAQPRRGGWRLRRSSAARTRALPGCRSWR